MKQVGDYAQANKLSETFNYSFLVVLTTSSYPLFVQVHNDDERFKNIYRSMAQKSSMLTFPIMITLIAIAKPLIYVLLSPKWLPAVSYFQLLCTASLFSVLYSLSVNALNAKGKSGLTFRLEIVKKALILISVFVCFKFGIIAMLAGYALASFISYSISAFLLKRKSSITSNTRYKILFPHFCSKFGLRELVMASHFL
ncbi:MAG: oligosaccharide flippase family protein [Paludibacteraceae bacterium]